MTPTTGKKVCYGGRAGVYIKPPDSEEARINENEHYVEIDFTTDIASFQARMAKNDNGVYASVVDDMQVDEDVPEGDQDELDVPEDEQDQENGSEEDAQACVEEENEDGTPALHFIDCIVQGEQRADGILEATLHALKQRFPHIA